jgi:hypothetical protein
MDLREAYDLVIANETRLLQTRRMVEGEQSFNYAHAPKGSVLPAKRAYAEAGKAADQQASVVHALIEHRPQGDQ